MGEDKMDQDLPFSSEDWVEMFKEAPCAYVLTDSNGKILKVNETLKEWLGYSSEELENKKLFQDLLSIGDRIFYETKHAALLKLQGHVNEINYNLLTKNKIKKPVLLNSRVSRKNENGIEVYQFIILPFSERKKYENELLLAKKRLNEASEAKSTFFSTITHEIRTPIHAILNAGNILLKEDPTPEQTELLEVINYSSFNLLELINSILDLTKMEHGKTIIKAESFDLKSLLQNLFRIYQPLAVGKNIEFTLLVPETLPQFFIGDSAKIRQIFTNLIGNAIKFTEKGVIRLKLIVLERDQDKYTIQFNLLDTGIGMSTEELQKIFEPFTQANISIHQQFGGSGLGLTITQKLLKFLESDLIVKSEVGKGSTFSFDLTFESTTQVPSKSELSQLPIDHFDLSKLSILVVDDIYSNILILKRYFKIWNAKFKYTSNGKDAIDKVKKKDFDIIFMDINMPQMDGYETAERIRNLKGKKNQEVPIIALSAFDSNDIKDKVYHSGMNGMLPKPFNGEQLYNVITTFANVRERRSFKNYSEGSKKGIKLAFQSTRLCNFFENDFQAITEYLNVAVKEVDQIIIDFSEAERTFSLPMFKQAAHKNSSLYRLLHLEELQTKIKEAETSLSKGEREKFLKESKEINLALKKIVAWMRAKVGQGKDICAGSYEEVL